MKREWKPGDVALVTGPSRMITLGLDDKKHLTALCRRENDVWIALGLDPRRGFTDAEVTSASPSHLVVIDPEDREQVERLHQSILRAYGQQKVTDFADNTTLMQAALREFANPTPPKPEEPMGLGAVVETEADGDFIRVSCELLNPWLNVPTGAHCPWDRVAAIRVLSEGVAS